MTFIKVLNIWLSINEIKEKKEGNRKEIENNWNLLSLTLNIKVWIYT